MAHCMVWTACTCEPQVHRTAVYPQEARSASNRLVSLYVLIISFDSLRICSIVAYVVKNQALYTACSTKRGRPGRRGLGKEYRAVRASKLRCLFVSTEDSRNISFTIFCASTIFFQLRKRKCFYWARKRSELRRDESIRFRFKSPRSGA